MIQKKGMPIFKDVLNETTGDNRLELGFDTINGHMVIYLTHQETDGYGTLRAATMPEAEVRLTMAEKDGGKIWRYISDDYEEDIKDFLSELEKLADEFDMKLKELLTKRNFK